MGVRPPTGQLYDPKSGTLRTTVSRPQGWMPSSVAPTSYGVQFPDSTLPNPDCMAATTNIERVNAVREGRQIPTAPDTQGPFMEAMGSSKPLRMDPVVQDALHGQFVHLTSKITGLQNRVADLIEEREQVTHTNGTLSGKALFNRGSPLANTGQTPRVRTMKDVPTFSGLGAEEEEREDDWDFTYEGPDPRNDIYPSSIITHKPPQVPSFSEEDGDFKEWWFMFKRGQPLFLMQRDDEKWAAVAAKLKGKAREYWNAWWRSSGTTFRQGIEHMIRFYSPHEQGLAVYERLREIRQKPGKSVREYIRDFAVYVSRHIPNGFDRIEIKQLFLQGLSDHLRQGLDHVMDLDVREIMTKATQYEMQNPEHLYDRRSKKSNSVEINTCSNGDEGEPLYPDNRKPPNNPPGTKAAFNNTTAQNAYTTRPNGPALPVEKLKSRSGIELVKYKGNVWNYDEFTKICRADQLCFRCGGKRPSGGSMPVVKIFCSLGSPLNSASATSDFLQIPRIPNPTQSTAPKPYDLRQPVLPRRNLVPTLPQPPPMAAFANLSLGEVSVEQHVQELIEAEAELGVL